MILRPILGRATVFAAVSLLLPQTRIGCQQGSGDDPERTAARAGFATAGFALSFAWRLRSLSARWQVFAQEPPALSGCGRSVGAYSSNSTRFEQK